MTARPWVHVRAVLIMKVNVPMSIVAVTMLVQVDVGAPLQSATEGDYAKADDH